MAYPALLASPPAQPPKPALHRGCKQSQREAKSPPVLQPCLTLQPLPKHASSPAPLRAVASKASLQTSVDGTIAQVKTSPWGPLAL